MSFLKITGNPLYPKEVKRKELLFMGDKMRFNLLDLHEPKEDTNVRKLLRVYSVIPRFAAHDNPEHAEQAIRVTNFLRKVNERLRKEVGLGWKYKWMEATESKFAKETHKDWFIGRASVPLTALEQLEMFGLRKEVENWWTAATSSVPQPESFSKCLTR